MGVVANPAKPAGRQVIRRAVRLILGAGREVRTEPLTAKLVGLGGALADCGSVPALAAESDLLLVFGGDGTILGVAREIAGTQTPLLGINLGTLGFLTATTARRLPQTLEQLWAGRCELEERPLIAATLPHRQPAFREVALNDFVISRGTVPRLIELEVRVDGELLTSYRGDGLIVSSPTGSTAYSLAAGGAVVSPQAEVFALTPICAHTLSSRSVIVSLHSTIEVRLRSERVETFLAGDGQMSVRLEAGEVVTLTRSACTCHLVRLAGASFFDTLRQKLNWSGSTL